MKTFSHVGFGEILSLALLLVTGTLLLVGSAQLPPPTFDPLGPGGFPRYIAFVLLALVALRIVLIVREALRRAAEDKSVVRDLIPVTKAVTSGLTVIAYLVLLEVGGIAFPVLTCIFMFVFGAAMSGLAPKKLAILAVVGVVMSFGLSFVFSEFLGVILPG